jgi:uncharacterized protein YcbK (DUF882 family)
MYDLRKKKDWRKFSMQGANLKRLDTIIPNTRHNKKAKQGRQ